MLSTSQKMKIDKNKLNFLNPCQNLTKHQPTRANATFQTNVVVNAYSSLPVVSSGAFVQRY